MQCGFDISHILANSSRLSAFAGIRKLRLAYMFDGEKVCSV